MVQYEMVVAHTRVAEVELERRRQVSAGCEAELIGLVDMERNRRIKDDFQVDLSNLAYGAIAIFEKY